MSVFKASFTNNSDTLIKLGINNFQVISENELLNPLKTEYFEKAFDRNSEKLKNILRMNLSDDIIILPKQSIIKYFAVPTLNPSNKGLSIKFLYNNKVYNYDYDLNILSSKESFNFIGVKIKKQKDAITDIVINQQGRIYSLTDNIIYVLENKQTEPLTIYSMKVSNGYAEYGKVVNIRAYDFQNSNIIIPTRSLNVIKKNPNDIKYLVPQKSVIRL